MSMYGTTIWDDFDRALRWPLGRRSGHFFRALEQALETGDRSRTARAEAAAGYNLRDTGEALELVAMLPGIERSAVEVTLEHDVLTISATRRLEVPGDHKPLRQERTSWQFQRSVALPTPVDAEQTRATLDNGVLRIRMAKAPEHRPRQIQVD